MKVLSLFSGVGGFDLGLEAAGMETVGLCEWDTKAQAILRRHWPHIPIYGDVSDLTGTQLITDGVQPDLVAFGSPCQDLSVAGKRAGLAGERSGLFHEAIRIIRELRSLTNGTLPRWIIWENVVGALNSNGGADFQAVLNEMGDLGAHLIEWAVLDAQNFGVAQRRRRLFLITCLDSVTARGCPDPLLPLGEGRPGNLAALRAAWKDAPRTTTDSPGNGDFAARAEGFGKYSLDDRTGTLKTRGNHADIDYVLSQAVVETPIGFSHTQGLDAQPSEDAWPTLRREGNGHAVAQWWNGTDVADTITTTSDAQRMPDKDRLQAVITSYSVRRLLPVECERLMGWPDDWTRWDADGHEQTDSHRYKQIGNGVAAPVAAWVGRHLRAIDIIARSRA